jgi:hypothetical protein
MAHGGPHVSVLWQPLPGIQGGPHEGINSVVSQLRDYNYGALKTIKGGPNEDIRAVAVGGTVRIDLDPGSMFYRSGFRIQDI